MMRVAPARVVRPVSDFRSPAVASAVAAAVAPLAAAAATHAAAAIAQRATAVAAASDVWDVP